MKRRTLIAAMIAWLGFVKPKAQGELVNVSIGEDRPGAIERPNCIYIDRDGIIAETDSGSCSIAWELLDWIYRERGSVRETLQSRHRKWSREEPVIVMSMETYKSVRKQILELSPSCGRFTFGTELPEHHLFGIRVIFPETALHKT